MFETQHHLIKMARIKDDNNYYHRAWSGDLAGTMEDAATKAASQCS